MRNFRDNAVPYIFWTFVILVLTAGTWFVVTSREHVDIDISGPGNEQDNGLPRKVHLDQPIINEVSADGKVNWTLYIDDFESEPGSIMNLSKPRARYYLPSGEKLEVSSEAGTYDEDSGVLFLTGNVRGETFESKLNFTVSELKWDNAAGLLTATGGVDVVREGIKFTGSELTVDLSEDLGKLEVKGGEVGVNITSDAESLENLNVTE